MGPPNELDRASWLQGPEAHCETLPKAQYPAKRLILLGAPGVGKGTQADLLHQQFGACHLSTGDVFRMAGNRSVCDQSPAHQQALAHIRRGDLVPDSIVWETVRERRDCLH